MIHELSGIIANRPRLDCPSPRDPWVGERARILRGQAIIADLTRDHACGNPRGAETPHRSSDRVIGIIEKNPALDGRNLAEQVERPPRWGPPYYIIM